MLRSVRLDLGGEQMRVCVGSIFLCAVSLLNAACARDLSHKETASSFWALVGIANTRVNVARFLYSGNAGGVAPFTVAAFSVNARSGVLTKLGTTTSFAGPVSDLRLDSSGAFGYAAVSTVDHLGVFGIDSVTGTPAFHQSVTTGTAGPDSISCTRRCAWSTFHI